MGRIATIAALLAITGSASAGQPGPIEEVVVTARAQQLYRVGETSTGKLPADPLSSSVVITTINEQLIEDQGARDAQDIYRNISGVSLFSYAGVTARGFRQEEIFFDGLRGDPYVGFNVPQLFNIERVDFLKGPAGMLYGPGAPGGLFNYVTKKPSREFAAEARAVAGDDDRVGGQFEINGALPVDGTSGRVGVFIENRDSFRDNADSEVRIYDAGIAHEFESARAEIACAGCPSITTAISSPTSAGTTTRRATSSTSSRTTCRPSSKAPPAASPGTRSCATPRRSSHRSTTNRSS